MRALLFAVLLVVGLVLTAAGVQPVLSLAGVYLVHYLSLRGQLVRAQAQA